MGQGNYDHPSYLTRQQIPLNNTIAGAAGTSAHRVFNSNMRIRQVVGAVVTAGTIGTNVQSILFNGTTILGTINYGTGGNNVAAAGTLADINATVTAGGVVSVKNGADATAVTAVTLEAYLDPAASWTGVGN